MHTTNLSKENNAGVSTLGSAQVTSDTLMKWDLNKIFVTATNVKLDIKILHLQHVVFCDFVNLSGSLGILNVNGPVVQ